MNKLQARDALVGAWRLLSWENQAADGQVTYPMGPDPNGYVIYAADGRFSVTISRRGRAGFAAGDLLGGTTEEAVGRAGRGPADPQRQPAAARGQAAGAPPGLAAGRPTLNANDRYTRAETQVHGRRQKASATPQLWSPSRHSSPGRWRGWRTRQAGGCLMATAVPGLSRCGLPRMVTSSGAPSSRR
jgi:hypothetical protein